MTYPDERMVYHRGRGGTLISHSQRLSADCQDCARERGENG